MSLQSNTYFFFDRGLRNPQTCVNIDVHVCPAQKDERAGVMFTEGWQETPAKPWEVRYDNAYPNVIYDDETGIYHCYYTLFTRDDDAEGVPRSERAKRQYHPTPSRVTSLCYACSRDGVHWEKPNLGLVPYKGSTDNNILFHYAHGTGVFLDRAETDRSKRFKMVTKVEAHGGSVNYMAVNFSGDGVHWGRMIRWPKYNPQADSHNFPFRDPQDGKFKMITRTWNGGVRISSICESTDFINWSEPVEITRGQTFADQVYSMPAFYYKGLFFGLASLFHEGDRAETDFDTVDLELRYGTTAKHFEPIVPGEYLIRRGAGRYPDGAFDCGCIYSAAPMEVDGKLCFYYMGGNGQHTNFRETSLGRAFLEKDKFAYVCPKDAEKEGFIATQRLHVFGDDVEILCDIEEGGEVAVAYYDRAGGVPLEGFGFEDCRLEKGADGYLHIVFDRSADTLRVPTVSVAVRMKKAKVYAIRGDLSITEGRYY